MYLTRGGWLWNHLQWISSPFPQLPLSKTITTVPVQSTVLDFNCLDCCQVQLGKTFWVHQPIWAMLWKGTVNLSKADNYSKDEITKTLPQSLVRFGCSCLFHQAGSVRSRPKGVGTVYVPTLTVFSIRLQAFIALSQSPLKVKILLYFSWFITKFSPPLPLSHPVSGTLQSVSALRLWKPVSAVPTRTIIQLHNTVMQERAAFTSSSSGNERQREEWRVL